jgi:UDP-N-acetylglucosamine 2-epimerase (non-hydrolysing)
MERFESVVLNERPHLVLVVGDVNSTVACALVTKKTWCRGYQDGEDFIPKLAHVEAGLRSFDRTMPEEINRIVTDSVSDYLFTTEESANQNLLREGTPREHIFFVGNVMIDTLLRHRSKAKESTILQDLRLTDDHEVKPYAILTLHCRPNNVNDKGAFSHMLNAFFDISQHMPLIFPVHPETLKRIQDEDLGDYFVDHFVQGPEPWDSRVRIRLVPPLGYLDFLRLMSEAKVVLMDSGGAQKKQLSSESRVLLCGIERKGRSRSSRARTSWQVRIRNGLLENSINYPVTARNRIRLLVIGMVMPLSELSKCWSTTFVRSGRQ